MGSLDDPESTGPANRNHSSIITSKNFFDNNSLPVILCLHGGGSNARIFRFQCRRLESVLRHRFRFVYPNAPLPSKPGWGIVPVFESVKPYYRWVTDVWGKTPDKQEPPEDEIAGLNEVIDRSIQLAGGPETIVGVIGFSQGARLASGVVCREYERRRKHMDNIYNQDDSDKPWPNFKFGLTVGGPYPPISLTPQPSDKADLEGLRQIPVVHAWGRTDHVKEGCQKLAEVADSSRMFVYEFEGEHHMPLSDWESKELAAFVEEAAGMEVRIE